MNHTFQKNFKLQFSNLRLCDVTVAGTFADATMTLSYDMARKRITLGVLDDAAGHVMSLLTRIPPKSVLVNSDVRDLLFSLTVSPNQGDGYTLKFDGLTLKGHEIDRGNKVDFDLSAFFQQNPVNTACAHKVVFEYETVNVSGRGGDQPSSESVPN